MATDRIIHSITAAQGSYFLVIYRDIPRHNGSTFDPGPEVGRVELVPKDPQSESWGGPYAVTDEEITIPKGSFLRIERTDPDEL